MRLPVAEVRSKSNDSNDPITQLPDTGSYSIHRVGSTSPTRGADVLWAAAEQVEIAGQRLFEEALLLERLAEDDARACRGGVRWSSPRRAAASDRRKPARRARRACKWPVPRVRPFRGGLAIGRRRPRRARRRPDRAIARAAARRAASPRG